MKALIEKLLSEVDEDIKDAMSQIEPHNQKFGYRNWEVLRDPANTILNWQLLRDRRKTK